MLVVYDVWHHRTRKPPIPSVRRHVDEKLASLKRCVFGDRFHRIRVDGALMSKRKNNSPRQHTFLYISSSLHDYVVKMPNFIFCGGREQATATFSSSFLTWLWFSGIPLQQSWSTFDKVGDRDEDWKKTNALFKRYFSTAVAIVGFWGPSWSVLYGPVM